MKATREKRAKALAAWICKERDEVIREQLIYWLMTGMFARDACVALGSAPHGWEWAIRLMRRHREAV